MEQVVIRSSNNNSVHYGSIWCDRVETVSFPHSTWSKFFVGATLVASLWSPEVSWWVERRKD